MKNFLAALLVAWCLTSCVVFAEAPRFWNGDKNYPLVCEDSQSAWYLNKNSVAVKINDPPFFIITAQVVTMSGSDTYEFFFDEDDIDMRVFDKAISDWRPLNPSELTAKNQYAMYVGEAVFYITQGRKFYGNYLWKAKVDGKTYKIDRFTDEIYRDWR